MTALAGVPLVRGGGRGWRMVTRQSRVWLGALVIGSSLAAGSAQAATFTVVVNTDAGASG
jgi:hypothetical protein